MCVIFFLGEFELMYLQCTPNHCVGVKKKTTKEGEKSSDQALKVRENQTLQHKRQKKKKNKRPQQVTSHFISLFFFNLQKQGVSPKCKSPTAHTQKGETRKKKEKHTFLLLLLVITCQQREKKEAVLLHRDCLIGYLIKSSTVKRWNPGTKKKKKQSKKKRGKKKFGNMGLVMSLRRDTYSVRGDERKE
jgi:hypothetical protein